MISLQYGDIQYSWIAALGYPKRDTITMLLSSRSFSRQNTNDKDDFLDSVEMSLLGPMNGSSLSSVVPFKGGQSWYS